MGDRILRTIVAVGAAAVAASVVLPVFAANPLSGGDIAARFGTGNAIKGTSIPGGTAYLLTLGRDGVATMQPARGDRTLRTGTWRASATGYCSEWGTGAERCYAIVRNGRAYDVIDSGGKVVARWTT